VEEKTFVWKLDSKRAVCLVPDLLFCVQPNIPWRTVSWGINPFFLYLFSDLHYIHFLVGREIMDSLDVKKYFLLSVPLAICAEKEFFFDT